jgi:hypothetical protein
MAVDKIRTGRYIHRLMRLRCRRTVPGWQAEKMTMMSDAAEAGHNDAASGGDLKAKDPRQQSTIQFPYGDLDSAVEVARAIFEKGGGGSCSQDQLVAYLGHSEPSGTFRQKVSSAKIFGLVEAAGVGEVRLTDLGHRVVDRSQERQAKSEAFLNVELYRKLYDEHKGRILPPRPAPLERTFVNYGVSPKQKDKARQAFERSAQQAGFFEHGRDRLVMPSGASAQLKPEKEDARRPPSGGGGAGNGGDGADGLELDPLIVGLLKRMPPPPDGWPAPDMARWAKAFLMNLSFIYGHTVDDDVVDVVVRKRREDQDAG